MHDVCVTVLIEVFSVGPRNSRTVFGRIHRRAAQMTLFDKGCLHEPPVLVTARVLAHH